MIEDITYQVANFEETAMDLLTKLTEDMKTAMKSGQKDRLMVIRMLLVGCEEYRPDAQ